MATNYATMENLQRVVENVKVYVDSDKTKSIKGYLKKNNTWNFYNTDAPTEDSVPVISIDVPVEYFLDQTKTTFVQEFAWSEEVYAGSVNPNLDGKPVWVMAVKGDDDSVTYSFANLEALVDVYTVENTETVSMEIGEGNVIKADVNVSEEEGNIISVKEDGLFASVEAVDISGKADKLVNPEEGDTVVKAGQILVDDGNGNLAASGKTIEELTEEILANFEPITDDEIDSWF